MRAARRGQAPPWPPGTRRSGGFREPPTYTRYPHYPQVDSPFIARIFVTLWLRGRDDLPATGDSLPSHSPSGNRADRLRAAGRTDAEGRAADEAAARRKLRACPLANAKAACFVKRPRNPGGLRARGGPIRNREPSGLRNRKGGTPDFGPGPVRRKAGLRPTRRHRRRRSFGFIVLRAGPEASAFGSCETAGTQGFGRWTCQAEPGLRPRIPRRAEPKASAGGTAKAGRRISVPNLPSGEPPGLRP
jgi:hypothetical protein